MNLMVVKLAGRLPEAFLAAGGVGPSRSLLQEEESLEFGLETKSSLKSLCHWLDFWNFGGGSSPFRAVGMSSVMCCGTMVLYFVKICHLYFNKTLIDQ